MWFRFRICRAQIIFQQHGKYEIFDLYTAREEGYIEEEYYTWWGEDRYLFETAKDELIVNILAARNRDSGEVETNSGYGNRL